MERKYSVSDALARLNKAKEHVAEKRLTPEELAAKRRAEIQNRFSVIVSIIRLCSAPIVHCAF